MLILLTYDVSTETPEGRRRLNKVAKKCVAHGQRVQNSVFECNLDWSQFIVLQNELKKIIDPCEDSLRFYNLGNSYKEKVTHIGIKPSIDLEGELII
jgi:CRISPR-associated protein Cas2